MLAFSFFKKHYAILFFLAIITITACEKNSTPILQQPTQDAKISMRGPVNMDTVGYYHNEFLKHIYNSHLDSFISYGDDHPDFVKFLHREWEDYYRDEIQDVSSYILDHDTILIQGVHLTEFASIENYTSWTQEEYDSLEVVYDVIYDLQFNKSAGISEILDSIESGINDLDAEDFTSEIEIINTLIMWSYSLQLADYIFEKEGSPQGLSNCFWWGVWADVMAANDFEYVQEAGMDEEYIQIIRISSGVGVSVCLDY